MSNRHVTSAITFITQAAVVGLVVVLVMQALISTSGGAAPIAGFL
ncbi:hypothetical protein [Teredinibacter waterburyi]|nr:hypothetical protein [Teredinibacter waterburyi]